MAGFSVAAVRAQFPALARQIGGRPVVYLDSAASALKPRAVIDAVAGYLAGNGANIHRGLHSMSQEASEDFEATRAAAARFFGASADDEIVFTKNATESLGLVAAGLDLDPADNVVGTIVDHHSNILPWRVRCAYRYADVLRDDPPFEGVARLIDSRTRAIVAPLYSNVIGARLPVESLVALANEHGIPLVVDAAQAAGHVPLDLAAMGADFVALSGHKMGAPPGVGVLYGRREWLGRLRRTSVGGGTVATFDDEPVFRRPPWCFEAGTPDIAAVLGFRAAMRFLDDVGLADAHQHVCSAWSAAMDATRHEQLDTRFEIATGREGDTVGIISFAPRDERVDPARLSQILSDTYGVMARAGSHCAHPLHKALGWTRGSLRFSFQLYNTADEATYAVRALATATRMLAG